MRELRASPPDAGKKAVLMGVGQQPPRLGTLLSSDVRDRSGMCADCFEKTNKSAPRMKKRAALRNEYVIAAVGTVKLATPRRSQDIPTGEVELRVQELRILQCVQAAAVPAQRQRR